MVNDFEIYIDGSCKGNPGPGGYAAVILNSGHVVEKIVGGDPDTTNNRMELMAAIESLKELKVIHKGFYSLVVYSDSKYVLLGVTSWINSWSKNGWVNALGEPIKNKDLWQELHDVQENLEIDWQWVKGHSGNKWNDYVDRLAREAADGVYDFTL